jgi:mannose-6-phosphate isomerase-like protein (cupin superfamily)
MRISDVPGHETVMVSVLHEDTRELCHWQTIAPAELTVAPHHHHRDEVLTVQSGRIRFFLD